MAVSVPWLLRKAQLMLRRGDAISDAEQLSRSTAMTNAVAAESDGSLPASGPPSFTPAPGGDVRPVGDAVPEPERAEDPVDVASDGSFPASDPPSFTPTSGNVPRPPRKP